MTPGFAIAKPDDAIALARPVGLRFLLVEPVRHGLLLLAEAIEAASESATLAWSESPDFALMELIAGESAVASTSEGEAKLLSTKSAIELVDEDQDMSGHLAVVGVFSLPSDFGESTSSIDCERSGTSIS